MAARKTPTGQALAEVADAPEPQPEEQQPINGVLVVRTERPDGNIDIDVQKLGDVKLTEIKSILEWGLKRFEETVGL